MATRPNHLKSGELASLELSFEGRDVTLAEIHAYLFDSMGTLLSRYTAHPGKVALGTNLELTKIARILVGPAVDDLPMLPLTVPRLRHFHMFEASVCIAADQRDIVLPPIPEAVWRWWLVHNGWAQLTKHVAGLTSVSVLL